MLQDVMVYGRQSLNWQERLRSMHRSASVRRHSTVQPSSCLTVAGLAQTARAEVQVAGHSEDPTTTDETSTSRAALEESLVPLEEAVSESSTNEIDRFEALVCLGCGHWKLGARDRALVTLPTLPEDDLIRLVDSGSAWTLVCAVKGAYLRGS